MASVRNRPACSLDSLLCLANSAAAQDGLLLLVAELLGIVHHQFRVQQAEVGKGVFRFLRCGVAKQLGQVLVAQLFGHL